LTLWSTKLNYPIAGKTYVFHALIFFLNFGAYISKHVLHFQNCQVFIREPYRDGRDNTWTGTGFMKVFDDAELVFDLKNIPITTNYEIVLRYEPQVSIVLQFSLVVQLVLEVNQNGVTYKKQLHNIQIENTWLLNHFIMYFRFNIQRILHINYII